MTPIIQLSNLGVRPQIARSRGPSLPDEASALSLKTVLRKTVLACLGRGPRAPFFEEGKDGTGLRVNPGTAAAHLNMDAGGTSSNPFTRVSPLIATKTALLVKGRGWGSNLRTLTTAIDMVLKIVFHRENCLLGDKVFLISG